MFATIGFVLFLLITLPLIITFMFLFFGGLILVHREPEERLRGKIGLLVAISALCITAAFLAALPFNIPHTPTLLLANTIQKYAIVFLWATGCVAASAAAKSKR